jgi:nitrogen fixation/metabolism regulation signal transduction histidine kinase
MSRFEIKIVAALLVIAVIPLAASVVLVGQVIRVSDSVALGQSQRLSAPLERAADAYRGLFAARKQVFRLQASLLARDAKLLAALDPLDPTALATRLRELAEGDPAMVSLEVLDRARRVLGRGGRATPAPAQVRDLRVEEPLGAAGHRLRAVFVTPSAPFDEFRALGQAQGATTQINLIRDELSYLYRFAFLLMFGVVLLVSTLLGLFIARHTARRVALLAAATRKVAEGDLETRVALGGRDELGELASAFNEMVGQVQESRERIAYLEKIGAWQEIARRLAHEIKNPLTPIQLAVQQLHRKYAGEDPGFQRMLDDARDIITEEVDALRRLVQEFSAFAKLPSVKPEPVDLSSLVDDFLKSHTELAERATILWTPLEPPPRVSVDRMLLKSVLFNLVENAIQAAEESGQKRLSVALEAVLDLPHRRVVLKVIDDGPGMTREVAAHVFDPYFTTKERGTGLGLAIVKKIILEHGGTIRLASEPGKGTRFSVGLPLAGE